MNTLKINDQVSISIFEPSEEKLNEMVKISVGTNTIKLSIEDMNCICSTWESLKK